LETVEDLGHFCGHKDDRNRGIIWRRVVLCCHAWGLYLTDKDTYELEAVERAITGNLILAGSSEIRRLTGFTKNEATGLLKSAISKIQSVDRRHNFILREPLTPEEWSVFTQFKTLPHDDSLLAFDHCRLTQQLAECLVAEKVIDESDIPKVLAQAEFVGLFAVYKMHNCKCLLTDNTVAVLKAYPNFNMPNVIDVKLFYDIKGITLMRPVFQCSCDFERFVDRTLWPLYHGNSMFGMPDWDVGLEIDQECKLVRIE